jgi:streptogramin lyase
MRNLLIAAASVALLASAGSAFAAEQTDGTVQSVDAANGSLTLQSGQTFKFANGTQLYGVAPGQTIGVTYEGNQGIGAFDPNPAKVNNIDVH